MKVAIIQMNVVAGQPETNFERAERLVRQAAPLADVVLLPEMWNAGYALDRIEQLGDQEAGRTIAVMGALARQYGVHIVAGSIAAIYQDGVYNECLVFDRDGAVVDRYRKVHRFRLLHEHHFLSPGKRWVVFDLDGIRAGVMICYDLRFPELARTLVLQGATLLFLPAQWPYPRLEHWRILQQARAIENQCFVISANAVGQNGEDHFFGHSMVVDPWGQVLVEGGEEEDVIVADIDLDLVGQVRQQITVFVDRRPDVYEL